MIQTCNHRLRKAIGYKRRSSTKQECNNSFEIQERAIKSKAAAEGYQIVEFIEDDAVSAYSKQAIKRPGVKRLFECLQHEDVDAIFFYDETRIDRQFNDFVNNVIRPIRQSYPHLKFFCTNSEGEWNENDPMVQAKLIFSLQESKIKSDRIKSYRKTVLYPRDDGNKKTLEKDPIRPGSRVPYGFQKYEHAYLAHPDESPIVTFIYYLDSWGHSNKAISDLLNDCGVSSPAGGKWNPSSVDVILNNVSYIGYYPDSERKEHWSDHRRKESFIGLLPKVHDSLITALTWEISFRLRRLKKELGKHDTPYLLRGLIHCKRCNVPLLTKDQSPAKSNTKYVFYRCPQCRYKVCLQSVHSHILNHLMKDLGQQISDSKQYISKLLKKWNSELTKNLKTVDESLERIDNHERLLQKDNPHYAFWHKGLITSREFLSKVRNRTLELLNKTNALDSEVSSDEFFKRFSELDYNNLSQVELRTLCLIFIEKVFIDLQNNNRLSVHFYYEPFFSLNDAVGRLTEKTTGSLVR
jgi:site-specific DNA recombinase